MPEYRVNVVDPDNVLGQSSSWNRYRSDVPLEYGNEIMIEPAEPGVAGAPGSLRARVMSVDNDAFFSSTVTVEPIREN